MSEQSEIDKAIPVGLWYGLSDNQKREALSNAYCEKKKYYIAANDYAAAKIEDVLALEEGDPEE